MRDLTSMHETNRRAAAAATERKARDMVDAPWPPSGFTIRFEESPEGIRYRAVSSDGTWESSYLWALYSSAIGDAQAKAFE